MDLLLSLAGNFGRLLLIFGLAGLVLLPWALLFRAFRESALWGIACLVFPLASLLFVARFWKESRRLVFTYLIVLGVTVLGLGLISLDPEVREKASAVYDKRQERRKALKEAGGSLAGHRAAFDESERGKREMAEVQQRARELYAFVQGWREELLERQPGEEASEAERAEFRAEHANYTGLLNEYKRTVELLKKVESGQGAAATPSAEKISEEGL